MPPTSQPTPRPPDNAEALTVLVLRYLDGDCSGEEVARLRAALTGSAASRAFFVQVCRAHGELHEAYSPKRAEWEHRQTQARAASPVAVSAGQAAGETTRPLTPAGGGLIRGQEPPDQAGDARPAPVWPADPAVPDAGAETAIQQLSGEDTHFPKDKTPDK